MFSHLSINAIYFPILDISLTTRLVMTSLNSMTYLSLNCFGQFCSYIVLANILTILVLPTPLGPTIATVFLSYLLNMLKILSITSSYPIRLLYIPVDAILTRFLQLVSTILFSLGITLLGCILPVFPRNLFSSSIVNVVAPWSGSFGFGLFLFHLLVFISLLLTLAVVLYAITVSLTWSGVTPSFVSCFTISGSLFIIEFSINELVTKLAPLSIISVANLS